MHSIAWRLEKHTARLKCDRFSATVDLTQPAEGMVEVCAGGCRLGGCRLLAVAMPSFPVGDADSLIERYVRGAELVGAYKESADHPVRVDVLWRAVGPNAGGRFVAAVELVVSVRTHVLEGCAELAVQSDVPACDTLRLTDADAAKYRPSAPPLRMDPREGPGCLLFRLPDAELSYAEMVHPIDFREDELSSDPASAGPLRVRHRLFSTRLEKGVILRARVRGVFLPRQDDLRTAAACYRAFAAAEPPLNT